ncbi:MAG: DUF2085 domain-containing protein [Bacteroidota bacterium]
MKENHIYILLLGAVMLWCGLIVGAPILASSGTHQVLSKEVYGFYGKVCHQLDDRSLHLDGEKFAVCARCTSVYFSFLGLLIVYPFLPKFNSGNGRRWIFVSLLPMLLDVGLDFAGIHESTIFTRLITGALFGMTIAYLLLPDLLSGLSGLFTLKKKKILSEL